MRSVHPFFPILTATPAETHNPPQWLADIKRISGFGDSLSSIRLSAFHPLVIPHPEALR